MGILIKGLKMPKHDGEILCIEIFPDGTVCMDMDLKCRKIAEAKELPPHGRLIDADALEEEPCDVVEDRFLYSVFGYSLDRIQTAPTIIEAEEE